MLNRIKSWFKTKEEKNFDRDLAHFQNLDSPLAAPNKDFIGTERKNEFFCDVCKEPAKHIAIVESDTGRHVIGAKCDEHIGMVIRQMTNEKFTGTRMQHSDMIHFAGFKSEPYSEWFECSCPKGTTHYILSDDVRLLNTKGKS